MSSLDAAETQGVVRAGPSEFLARGDGEGDSAEIRRVVVVGDRRMTDVLAAACPPTCVVDHVPGFLAGLAELITGSADRLLGPADALAGMRDAMLATLREASLADRVVLTEADPDARAEHEAAGFDRVLDPESSGARLAAALGVIPMGDDNELSIGREGSPSERDMTSDPPAEPNDEPLGDSDLVEAIHDAGAGGDERLPGLLFRLLAAESGIPGIGLLCEELAGAVTEADVPAGHTSVQIRFRGERFGWLHAASPATTEDLLPWAGWAGRWLGLHRQTRQLRDLAMKDELTGVWNRRYFNRFLKRILERAAVDRQQVTLLVFDIDDFKSYNDLHGHAAGDAILAGAAQLMQSTVRSHDVVARIGGDEFAVLFWDPRGRREEGSSHPDDVLAIARRFQSAITDLRFPQLSAEAPGRLTISGGIAGFPWDGRTPAELMHKADLMALESKAQGKNAITLGAARPREPASPVSPAPPAPID